MSNLKKAIFALVTLLMFMVMPAFAETGCKNGTFVGSYVSTFRTPDVWGDGSNVSHTYLLQLTFTSDGNVTEEFSGAPDIMLTSGTSTTGVGTWQCRQDGQLVVTVLSSAYVPTHDAPLHGVLNVPTDLLLFWNSRNTYLFSATDENTLTRIQARSRVYAPSEDPTNLQGGTLRPLSTTSVVYKRLKASDADLLAP